MTDFDIALRRQRSQVEDAMLRARQQQFQQRQQQQQQQQQQSRLVGQMTTIHRIGSMSCTYDDLPVLEPKDLGEIGQEKDDPASSEKFESACQHNSLSTVQAIVSSATRTPISLHRGLCSAISAGNMDIVRYLVSAGAPIAKMTPSFTVRTVPLDQQLPLFELFSQHGWIANSAEGALLLPLVITNLPLLRWLLDHGADPNLAAKPVYRFSSGGPEPNSCAALERAAYGGYVEAARILLDAGAEIRHGVPLHYAAGACLPGENPHAGRVTPSKEFDESRIPVMALLLDRGADVNQREEGQHRTARFAIVAAVMAGAVERVQWLLERGADPEARGDWGSAVTYANLLGSEEMKKVVEEGVKARRWMSSGNENLLLQGCPKLSG